MIDALAERLNRIDREQLTPIVRRALGEADADLGEWTRQDLSGSGGGQFNSTVISFAGNCRVNGEQQDWSLILKAVRDLGDDAPSSYAYWKREAEAYRSGWLANLPGDSLAAPACYGIEEYPGESCWLWLEKVDESPSGVWEMARYRVAARHLGRFNGAYLAGEPLPDFAWMSRQFVRQDIELAGQDIEKMDRPLHHGGLELFYARRRETARRLYANRERYLQAVARLPKTVAHHDGFRGNLFARQQNGIEQTVVIDWAFVGLEALGAELTAMVWVNLLFSTIAAADARALDEAVFDAYLDGLRDAGWVGDGALARLGFTASLGLRYVGTLVFAHKYFSTEAGRATLDSDPQTFDQLAEQLTALIPFIDQLVDEADERIAALS